MTLIRFTGYVVPEFYEMSLQKTARLSGDNFTWSISIQNGRLTVDCELKESDPDLAVVTTSVYEATSLLVSLFSLRDAKGMRVVLCEREIDGKRTAIVHDAPELSGLFPSLNQETLPAAFALIHQDQNLLRAILDLAEPLGFSHSAPTACARAIDAVCHHFIPPGKERRDGWAPMRDALRVSERYAKSITGASKGPRHGNWKEIREHNVAVGRRTFVLVDRFIQFRLGNNRPLNDAELLDLEV